MGNGVGKALESALKDEPEQETVRESGKNPFFNRHRRGIFSALTLTPCIGIPQLAERTGIAQNTVEWHLGILIKSGFLSEYKENRRRVFYPAGLLKKDEAGFFLRLNSPRLSGTLLEVIRGEGPTQSDISGMTGESRQTVASSLGELEKVGLITKLAEGKSRRYYSTTLLPDRAEEFYRRSKDFTVYFLKTVEDAGPKMGKKGLDRIIVEMGIRTRRFTMEVGINPYITCLSC